MVNIFVVFFCFAAITELSVKYISSKKVINNWPTHIHLFRNSSMVKIWAYDFVYVLSCMRGYVFCLATVEILIFSFNLWK